MTDPKSVRKWLSTLAHAYPSLLVSGVAHSALAEIERLEALSDPETTKQIEDLNAEVSAYKDAIERLEEIVPLAYEPGDRCMNRAALEDFIAMEAKLAIAVEALDLLKSKAGRWMEGANEPEFTRFGLVEVIAHNVLSKIRETK